MSYFSKNLIALRQRKRLTQEQLAQRVGVSTVIVSLWENDKKRPRKESIKQLCSALDCSEQDLMGYADGYYQRSTGLSSIAAKASNSYAPIAGNIAAGSPREAIELSNETHWCPPELLDKYPDCFFLRVSGDSMDKVLPDGSFALIAPEELTSGGIYAVKTNGNDATIKRVKALDDVVILEPMSNNPAHKRTIIDQDDPDAPSFRCLGRVVWYDVTL